MRPEQAYALSMAYTRETAEEFGAVKGASCTIKSIVHQNGQNLITFEWENSQGETRESTMTVYDGTPIYDWATGTSYKVDDLVIYEASFYKCITANSDAEFNPSKWIAIGSVDGNYNIVEDSTMLPSTFTSTDRKMYFVIDDNCFYLWNGVEWVAEEVEVEELTQAQMNNLISILQ